VFWFALGALWGRYSRFSLTRWLERQYRRAMARLNPDYRKHLEEKGY
jgi:hypothetical protein